MLMVMLIERAMLSRRCLPRAFAGPIELSKSLAINSDRDVTERGTRNINRWLLYKCVHPFLVLHTVVQVKGERRL